MGFGMAGFTAGWGTGRSLQRGVRRAGKRARAQWRRWLRWLRPPLGARGERAAARHLQRLGYTVVGRNIRTRHSELDLVAVDGRTVVFVEVKTLKSVERYHPAEMIDRDKEARLTRAALAYLKRHGLLEYPARFDVVAVTWPAGQNKPKIDHYPCAFDAIGRGQMFS